MKNFFRDVRMYEYLCLFMLCVMVLGDFLVVFINVFFKTYREILGWLSMFVNFYFIILFYVVVFYLLIVYVFVYGWNWLYFLMLMVTYVLLKFG